MSNIELISASSYDTSRMIFSEPIEGGIPDSKPPISFKRVNISTVYENGSTGPLIMGTERLYSYGLGEDTNPDTGKINGYKLPLALHNINGASQEEKDFVSTFESITKKCKDFLLKNKDKLEQYELEENDLKKLNPIYRKKEKDVVVETASPVLYAKLIVKKDKDGNKIITVFFDEDSGESINALDLLGKACYVRSAIKFESIFIGNKISIQIKLLECDVKVIKMSFRDELNIEVTGVRNNIKIKAINCLINKLKRSMRYTAQTGRTKGAIALTISFEKDDDDDDDEEYSVLRGLNEILRLEKDFEVSTWSTIYEWLLKQITKIGVFDGIDISLNIDTFEMEYFWEVEKE